MKITEYVWQLDADKQMDAIGFLTSMKRYMRASSSSTTRMVGELIPFEVEG